MDDAKLIDQLVRHEGLKLKPYKDTVGKLTIGIGRNLDDKGISKKEAFLLLHHDILEVKQELDRILPNWEIHPDKVQQVLINMVFNLGASRFLGFKKMLAALAIKDYQTAAAEMLDSKWAKQVGNRAIELANMVLEAHAN